MEASNSTLDFLLINSSKQYLSLSIIVFSNLAYYRTVKPKASYLSQYLVDLPDYLSIPRFVFHNKTDLTYTQEVLYVRLLFRYYTFR